MSTSKHILVTGGAGFIGSNLSRVLIETGARVDCVDNLITGRVESISALRRNRNFQYFKFDITDPEFLRTFQGTCYDEIYHLACPTGVPNIKRFGEEMLKTCSLGTENVLRLASSSNAKVIYTSSAEIYGDPEVFPQSEEYCGNVNPVGPRSAYEEGKRYAEALVQSYTENYYLDAKIVRIFNTFGPGMSADDSRVIPRFLKNIKEGRNIEIYGNGAQTRTHLYIDDLIRGLLLVVRKGQRGEVYNIGGEEQLCIVDLAEIIKSLSSVDVSVVYKPHFIEDHHGRFPSISKMKKLGWAPQVDVRDGLRRMLESWKIPLRSSVANEMKHRSESLKPGALVTESANTN
jgi:UDP-glucuronate decarboxylase